MKAYWVCIYEEINNPDKLKEYALKAKVAVEKLDEAMGHYASHKDDVRDELKSVTETINNIINDN